MTKEEFLGVSDIRNEHYKLGRSLPDDIRSYEEAVEIDGETVGIDREIVRLVKVMNRFPGITTLSCCAGHGDSEPRIWFSPKSFEDLPNMLYWFDACHSGCRWDVFIYTDCAASHVTWMLQARVKGDEAYQEGEKIAGHMEEYLDEQSQPEEGAAIG